MSLGESSAVVAGPSVEEITSSDGPQFAPGSVVEIRDEEWLVTGMERASDGWFVDVTGISGIVLDQTGTFSTELDTIVPRDPRQTKVVGDDSPRFRTARLWLESMVRRTAVPISESNLTVATRALADTLPYQERAAKLALTPDNLRPRILLADADADAVGIGKTRDRHDPRRTRAARPQRTHPRGHPKHVLEQMQF